MSIRRLILNDSSQPFYPEFPLEQYLPTWTLILKIIPSALSSQSSGTLFTEGDDGVCGDATSVGFAFFAGEAFSGYPSIPCFCIKLLDGVIVVGGVGVVVVEVDFGSSTTGLKISEGPAGGCSAGFWLCSTGVLLREDWSFARRFKRIYFISKKQTPKF